MTCEDEHIQRLPVDHFVLPEDAKPEYEKEENMLYYQHPSPLTFHVSAVEIIHIGEGPAGTRSEDNDHATNPQEEELPFQAGHNS